MAEITIIDPGPLGQIARAIRARLELAFPPKLFAHEWMPAKVDAGVWQMLTRRMPMIGIGFNALHDPKTMSTLNIMSRWSIYVATMNQRGPEAMFFGDKLAPGQFAMAGATAAMLHGFAIKGIGTIEVVEAANSFVENFNMAGLALTAIELTVAVDLAPGEVLAGDALTASELTGQTITWAFGGDTVMDITNTGDIMNRIIVMPGGPDRRVPVENLKRVYFEQKVPREVYRTSYIERRLLDGDLIEVTADGKPVAKPTPGATASAGTGAASVQVPATVSPAKPAPAPDAAASEAAKTGGAA